MFHILNFFIGMETENRKTLLRYQQKLMIRLLSKYLINLESGPSNRNSQKNSQLPDLIFRRPQNEKNPI